MVQAYVRDRILEFVEKPAFAKRLYMSPEDVREAAAEALTELARPGDATGTGSYKLVFRHSCLCAGCLPPRAAACCIVQAAVCLALDSTSACSTAPPAHHAGRFPLQRPFARPVCCPLVQMRHWCSEAPRAPQVPQRAPTGAQGARVCASCDSAVTRRATPYLNCCAAALACT